MLPYGEDNVERTVRVPIDIDHSELEGTLGLPDDAAGVVVFAHGSGSSRFSSRNRYVARVLREAGFATLLLDLLSLREEAVDEITRHHRFDIDMLADRIMAAIDWLESEPSTAELDVGLFGASTGAAAALVAAAQPPNRTRAVVSRGGRPDLAGELLPSVEAPTLLIVGGRDDVVIELNEEAMHQMQTEVRLEIVPNATHLFEEPGALEEVARLATHWFSRHLNSTWHSQSSRAHSSTTDRSPSSTPAKDPTLRPRSSGAERRKGRKASRSS